MEVLKKVAYSGLNGCSDEGVGSRAEVTSPHSSSAKGVREGRRLWAYSANNIGGICLELREQGRQAKCTEMIVPTLPGGGEV